MSSSSTKTASAAPSTGLLGRFGGMLLHPRRTLGSAFEAPRGATNAVLIAAVLVGLLASPIGAARAILLIPITFIGGLSNVVTVLAGSVLWELIALSLLGSMLAWVAHRRAPGSDTEGVHAAVMLTLVPYLALLLLGAFLDQSGLDALFGRLADLLPHRSWRGALRGRGFDLWVAAKLAIAYGPTLILLWWTTRRVTRGAPLSGPGGAAGAGRSGNGNGSGGRGGKRPHSA